jgi:hypothetical protein
MLTLIVAAGFVTAFVVLGIIVQKIGAPSVLAIFFAFYAIYDLVMWLGEKRARPTRAQVLEAGLIVEAAQPLEEIEAEQRQ